MGEREPEAWETSETRPVVTIRAGGPLEGVVTITAIEGGHGYVLVEAFWTENGHARHDSARVKGYRDAREIAHTAADQLAAGIAPDFTPD